MKKALEVKDWLRKQEWYERFKKNLDSSMQNPKDVLSGEMGMNTISRSFNWRTTPEGTDYWVKVNDEFMDWYLKSNKIWNTK